jgi:hypothetical protein
LVPLNAADLDDMESGWLVEDNYFESTTRCMFIGGGRQNTVRNNVFVNCTTPVHVDARGLGWMKCGAGQVYPKKFIDELEQVFHYREPPWSTAYPDINTTLAPCAPALNVITGNRFCQPKHVQPPAAAEASDDCATCPATHKYGYTPVPSNSPEGSVTGSYCCSGPTSDNSCHSRSICCLTPGSEKKTKYGSHGCEGIARCGNNPTNKKPCKPPPPPPTPGLPPGFSDFESTGAKTEWLNIFRNNSAFAVCPTALAVKHDDDDATDKFKQQITALDGITYSGDQGRRIRTSACVCAISPISPQQLRRQLRLLPGHRAPE